MISLISNYDEEWVYWFDLFARLWPKLMLDELAEMADRMLFNFGDANYRV